jgi:hypothetical protein
VALICKEKPVGLTVAEDHKLVVPHRVFESHHMQQARPVVSLREQDRMHDCRILHA